MKLSLNASDQKFRAGGNNLTVQGSLACFATYSVNETDKNISTYIVSCTFPNWNGIDRKRIFQHSRGRTQLDESYYDHRYRSRSPGLEAHKVGTGTRSPVQLAGAPCRRRYNPSYHDARALFKSSVMQTPAFSDQKDKNRR
ncbi:MAG: lipocalin-like domain-containing protein [Verrucomicrobia bacterium]|nr:lipocalin-like domain-containing protein [Verrucomicrobiota bacterium]